MAEEQAWIAVLKHDGNHRVEPMVVEVWTDDDGSNPYLVVNYDGIEWTIYGDWDAIEKVEEMTTSSGERLAGYYITSGRQEAVEMAVAYAKSKVPGLKKLAATTLSKITANEAFIKSMEDRSND